MKYEKSCGAIIYKDDCVLLVKHNQGHISFPKGHEECGETEQETALREVKEETGLDIVLENDFREVITYSPRENVIKDVVFFIGKYKGGKIVKQESEIADIKWIKFSQASLMITYKEDKEVFTKFINYIRRNYE